MSRAHLIKVGSEESERRYLNAEQILLRMLSMSAGDMFRELHELERRNLLMPVAEMPEGIQRVAIMLEKAVEQNIRNMEARAAERRAHKNERKGHRQH